MRYMFLPTSKQAQQALCHFLNIRRNQDAATYPSPQKRNLFISHIIETLELSSKWQVLEFLWDLSPTLWHTNVLAMCLEQFSSCPISIIPSMEWISVMSYEKRRAIKVLADQISMKDILYSEGVLLSCQMKAICF